MGILGKNSRRWVRRKNRRRRLTTERLENRHLLAIDFAAISGVSFEDMTGDGLTADDRRLELVSVELFLDDGDGVFDGGVADISQATTTTNVDGEYVFERLVAGSYFVQQTTPGGSIQRPGENVVAIDVSAADAGGTPGATIDSFDQTGQILIATSADPVQFSSVDAPEAVGGERDIRSEYVSGPGGGFERVIVSVNAADTSALLISQDAGTIGDYIFTWDGDDNDPFTLDPTGLGGFNLASEGPVTALQFSIAIDVGTTVQVDLHTDATHSSSASVFIPATGGSATFAEALIFLSDFVQTGVDGPADPSNLGAIQLIMPNQVDIDALVDFHRALGPTFLNANFANFVPQSLGNQVFDDLDANGVFDSGSEIGVSGVDVTLYRDVDGDAEFSVGDVVEATTTTTGPSGAYQFNGLIPGDFIVQLDEANFTSGGALEGFTSSPGNPDPNDGTDNDDNGLRLLGNGIVSSAISLESDGVAANDTDSTLDFGVVFAADLAITKTDTPDPVIAGNQLTYTLTVINNGDADATGVTVTDDLPTNVSFASASSSQGTFSESGGIFTAILGDLASGDSATIDLVVDVAPGTISQFSNTATVTGDQIDLIPANNTDTEPTDVLVRVDAAIIKSDSPDPATAGRELTYTLEVTNNGPSTATGVVVQDDLPDVLTFQNGASTRGAVSAVGQLVTAQIGTLEPNESARITIETLIDSSATGVISNTATVSTDGVETDETNNLDMEETTIVALVDLAITKQDSVDPVVPGTQLTYTLDVVNNGPSDATNVMVTDSLPDGVEYVSSSSSVGSVSETDNNIVVALGDLAVGESASIEIVVAVDPSVTSQFSNTAIVSSPEPDADLFNNTATEPTDVLPQFDLRIEKNDLPDPVVPGQQLTYTISVFNDGPSNATGVQVADTLPSVLSFDSGSTSQGTLTDNGQDLLAALGVIAVNESATITLVTDVSPDVVATIENTAIVSSDTGETDFTNNTDTEPTAVSPLVDVTISKSDSPDPANAGEQLIYEIEVTNNGPSTATNVIVTDPLPDELTFVSSSGSDGNVTVVGQDVSVAFGTLQPNESKSIQFTTGIASAAVGTITNIASVTTDTPETDLSNNQASASTSLDPMVDLVISKIDSVDPVVPGRSLGYTITVTNNGPADASGVTVIDTLPDGVSYSSGTTSQGTIDASGNAVTGLIGTLLVNQSATLTITTGVDPSLTTDFVNVATVSANEPEIDNSNNRAEEPTSVTPQVDVTITKTDTPDPATPGGSLAFEIVVTNNGPSTAENVSVSDPLPGTLSFVSGQATDVTILNNGQTVDAGFGDLLPGQSRSLIIASTIAVDAVGTIINTATVSTTTPETDLTNNSASAQTTLDPRVDLRITKTDSVDPVVPGQQLTYTLEVTNVGPSDASGVIVSDTLPAGVTFVSGSSTLGNVTAAGGVATASIGDLGVNESATITLVVDVSSAVTSQILNVATVTSEQIEIDGDNNRAEEPTDVRPEVDLSITKTDSVDPVTPGEQLTYTLQVTNSGPSDASNVIVTDTLPAGVAFASASSSQGSVVQNGNIVTANVGDLDLNETATITVVVDVSAAVTAQLLNVATVVADQIETDSSNNRVEEPTDVNAQVDLVIEKTDSVDPVVPGEELTYNLLVTNRGPTDATGVTVSDSLPVGVSFLRGSSEQGTLDVTGNQVTANVGELSAGESINVSIVVLVAPNVNQRLENTATVTGNEPDPDPGNNSSTEGTEVDPQFDLAVTKTDSVDPVVSGQSLTYTIDVINNGPSTARNVVVTDELPAGVVFQSGTNGLVANADTLMATIGTLEPGVSEQFQISVLVNSDVRGTINNVVTVTTDSGTETVPENNRDVEPTDTRAEIDLAIQKLVSATQVVPGQDLVYTLLVTNDGPSAATNVQVRDRLPSQLSFVSSSSSAGAVTNVGGEIIGTVPLLAPGGSAEFIIMAITDANASGSIVNTATVTGDQPERDPDDNQSTVVTELEPRSSISGYVFRDRNGNGQRDSGDVGIEGVSIQVAGTNALGQSVSRTVQTNSSGEYQFTDLLRGQYELIQVAQPEGYRDGEESLGAGASAIVGNDFFSQLMLDAGVDAIDFSFGELGRLTKRDFLGST